MNKRIEKECDNSCEYLLPDYLGDIKRVLHGGARVVKSGSFAGDGSLEVSGSVIYDLIYLDTENNLCEVSCSSDYDTNILLNMDGYVDSSVESLLTGTNYRATGPRKLNFKSRILHRVECEYSECDECEGVEGAECDEVSVMSFSALYGGKTELEYNETVGEIEASEDEVRVISSFGNVRITETESVEGGVVVRGEYIVGAIISTDGQPAFVITRSIPFEEKVSIDGADENMSAQADGQISSLNISLGNTGTKGEVNVSFTSDLYATVGMNKERRIVKDAYYKSVGSVAEYSTVCTSELVTMGEREETVRVTLPREELDAAEIRELLRVTAEPLRVQSTLTDKGLKISGDLSFSGVACEINEDGERAYTPMKFNKEMLLELPFGMDLPSGARADVSVSVSDVESTVSADELVFDVKMLLKYRVFMDTSMQSVKKLTKSGEELKSDPSVYTVYYPDKGESLFAVAKKFNTTRARLAADNALSEQTLSGESCELPKRLIIT